MLGNLFTSAGQLLVGQLGGAEQIIGGLLVLVLCAVGWLANWNRRQRADKKPGMASLTFIISCFAIAIIAVGAAAYGVGLRATTVSDDTKLLKPKLTSYDVEARLRAIDNLDDAMSKLQPLVQLGQNDLLNNIERYIASGEAAAKLLELGSQAKTAWDKINSGVGDYAGRQEPGEVRQKRLELCKDRSEIQ